MEKATFGAGCFWSVEAAFRQLPGVTGTRVGYAGGTVESPSYKQVCRGRTGHAEVVEVTYDPERVSYDELLEVFWAKHNPTSRNRQGLNFGSQYRSVIFFHSPEQESAARRDISRLEQAGRWRKRIATQVEPAPTFWEAEDYHQQYMETHGRSSCSVELASA